MDIFKEIPRVIYRGLLTHVGRNINFFQWKTVFKNTVITVYNTVSAKYVNLHLSRSWEMAANSLSQTGWTLKSILTRVLLTDILSVWLVGEEKKSWEWDIKREDWQSWKFIGFNNLPASQLPFSHFSLYKIIHFFYIVSTLTILCDKSARHIQKVMAWPFESIMSPLFFSH